MYLGVRTVRDDGLAIDSAGGELSDPRVDSRPDSSVHPESAAPFREAVTVNVLNPQVAVFFLAFLPQFVGEGRIEVQLTLLGVTYAVLTAGYLGAVAVAASALRRLLVTRPPVVDGIWWVTGLVLVGLGLRLVSFGRDA